MPRSPDCRSADPRRRARCAPGEAKVVFELKEYHRDVPDAELLADLCRVARRLDAARMTISRYSCEGRFGEGTLRRRFGGWKNALEAARLTFVPRPAVADETLVADLRRVARRLKLKRLKRRQYLAIGRYKFWRIRACFGTWDRALRAAGLEPAFPRLVPSHRLLSNLEHVWRQLGRQPAGADMTWPRSRYSVSPYTRCFGGFRKALEAFVAIKRQPRSKQPFAGGSMSVPLISPFLGSRRKTTRWINWRLRFLTIRRDGFRCRACGASPATIAGVQLEVDHIVPWSNGGETIEKNLQTLCQRCNGGKSNLDWRTTERTSARVTKR